MTVVPVGLRNSVLGHFSIPASRLKSPVQWCDRRGQLRRGIRCPTEKAAGSAVVSPAIAVGSLDRSAGISSPDIGMLCW
jgi:hypothetical protein